MANLTLFLFGGDYNCYRVGGTVLRGLYVLMTHGLTTHQHVNTDQDPVFNDKFSLFSGASQNYKEQLLETAPFLHFLQKGVWSGFQVGEQDDRYQIIDDFL